MDNWYKESKKRKKLHRKKHKKLVSPYIIDEDGVLKYRTEKGDLMIADNDEELEKESETELESYPEKIERCVQDIKKKQK